MNDSTRQRLCELIVKYGESLCDEPQRCEGLLRDLCPHHRREVYVLANALKARIGTDLRNSSDTVPIEMTLSRLVKRLEDEQGLSRDVATWVVESWALALGKISVGNLHAAATTSAAIASSISQQARRIAKHVRRNYAPSPDAAPHSNHLHFETPLPPKSPRGIVIAGAIALVMMAVFGAWWFGTQQRQQLATATAPATPVSQVQGSTTPEAAVAQIVSTGKAPDNVRPIKSQDTAEKNAQDGEKFLAQNKEKEGVKSTATGLQYKILREGYGTQPKSNDTVTVNWRGTLIDNTVFDSSYSRGEASTFPLNGTIKGFSEGLQLMKVGAKYQLFIPSNLAYRGRPVGADIGPNSTLVYEVELVGVTKSRQ